MTSKGLMTPGLTVKDKKPFYLVHAFNRVHNDNYPSKGYAGKSSAGFPYKDAIVEIDGIDQTSFLIADNGESKRDVVFMYSENNFMAVRWIRQRLLKSA